MSGVRILRLDEREEPRRRHWVAALERLFAPPASEDAIYKQDRRSIVYAARVLGRDVVVKRHRLTPHDRLRLFVGSGRGLGQWRGTRLLGRERAARVLMVAASANAEVLVMERVAGLTLLEVLAGRSSHTTRERHRLARMVGEQVARLALAGLRNRDHKPSNIVVSRDGPTVVDAVGVRRQRGGAAAREDAIVEMGVCLTLEPLGCGCAATSSDQRRVLLGAWSALVRAGCGPVMARGRWAREISRRVRMRVEEHGDPTPRVDPLARSALGG